MREGCAVVDEWFQKEHLPIETCKGHRDENDEEIENTEVSASNRHIEIELLTAGLHLAMDPRIPDSNEVFLFR